jgi:perosamine synthetase
VRKKGAIIMIPISRVLIDAETEELVMEVLRSGQLAQGPMVARFEEACAKMAGAKHAVAVNNGTTALEIALQAYNIGPGDEVITTPFTFAATVNAIVHSGARVRFADVTDDYTIDPAGIEALINKNTKAIMPVHLYGLPADMVAIDAIAKKHNLVIIEDAAQSHGAEVNGKPVGTYGLACFSFYATKNLSTGEGGVVTTNDDDLAERMRILRNQGMRARYAYEMPGHNYRMMDLVAALGISQFEKRPAMEAARRANADKLCKGMADLTSIVLPFEPAGRKSVWHQFTIRLSSTATVTRDQVLAGLQEKGVGAGIYYPKAAYDYDCYRNHPNIEAVTCPKSEEFALSVFSIPVHQYLSDDDINHIVKSIHEIVGS